jgi:hypothetical protein
MESETPPVTGYTEVNFLAKLRDRIVNQGMQVIVEAEVQGGRAKGIEHLEDLVFRNGSAGIKSALDIVKHTADNTGKTTTVKWDGKPALIFGRDPRDGKLAVMDKYMFDAGVFADSPQAWEQYDQQKSSGKQRPDLYKKLGHIWPGLDAAVGDSPGYFWGDLPR